MPLTVHTVQAGSPAARLGLGPGSVLLAADGSPLHDALDYQYYTTPAAFTLDCEIGGARKTLTVQKDEYEPFGCDFATYLGDAQHSCQNHCLFCFIDQLPKGLRPSLYFKDDDERLSFLYGNYITLTNLSEAEVERIIKLHISPIFVSVHTTDPALRVRMLANKRAGEVLGYLQRFAAAGIELNCQLVLCRGINDGDHLRRTLNDLLALRPRVGSIAAVPAGITAHRQGLYHLEAYDAATAAATLDILESHSRRCRAECGRSIVYPSDEWYLTAQRPIPPAGFYDDYAQLEDGVGMWRRYHDDFYKALAAHRGPVWPHKADTVTGMLAAPLVTATAAAVARRWPWAKITVHAIQNDFFGGNVSVAGLVTGQDIIKQCKGRLQSRTLLVPEVMLRDEGDRFLDDVTLPDLERALGCRAFAIPVTGEGTCEAFVHGGPCPPHAHSAWHKRAER